MPTVEQIAELRAANEGVRVAAVEDALALWRRYDPAVASDAMRDTLLELVREYGSVSAVTAADWYADLRADALPGRARWTPPLATIADDTADIVWRWVMQGYHHEDAATARQRLDHGTGRLVLQPGYLTVTHADRADPDPPRIARVARTTGCTFCRMIAARGAVFTDDTAGFSAHARCRCVAAPSWRTEDAPPADIEADQAYDAAVASGATGTHEILTHMRQTLNAP